VRRGVLGLTGLAAAGAVLGAALAHIPAPSDPSSFWIANYSAPWALLPFLAGRTQRTWRWALAAGVLLDVGCVLGFYSGFLTADAGRLGAAPETPPAELLVAGLVHWAVFTAPWVVLATATGAAYGLLGRAWARSRAAVACLAVISPFLAEPLLWRLYRGYLPGPLVVWVLEAAFGALLTVWFAVQLASARRHGV
jgi:hypothetical protein